ncbi:hypothetical protein WEN_01865 [Mycoplasma wenyonii str. Massachusetts]|uniref:Uncharacterized protein n=1 Tax=Mycoplasma wenyonii (strain Massachusetts) TaxID=1197325 RepID=I6YB20_MYCWM|nr:hypothetical protein [Mycoplasma wenyonii]AFN65166.1 hypothetical protein WEN_01865 [Mycoplasma wenyonii str. Massachusetts]
MPFKAGHLFKLVPVTIGGTYVTYPSFLPTMPKHIEGLLSERNCFIVQKGSDNNYLLACVTKIGKTFDFFFHNPSSSHSIPVKYLKLGSSSDSGGAQTKTKNLT